MDVRKCPIESKVAGSIPEGLKILKTNLMKLKQVHKDHEILGAGISFGKVP